MGKAKSLNDVSWSWTCLLPAAPAAKRLRTIPYFATCATTISAASLAT